MFGREARGEIRSIFDSLTRVTGSRIAAAVAECVSIVSDKCVLSMHIAFVSTSCALSALLPLSILSCCASHSPTLSPRFHQIAGISLEILDVRYAIVKYREGKNSPFFNIHFLSFSSNYFLAFSSTMNFSQPSIIYIYI